MCICQKKKGNFCKYFGKAFWNLLLIHAVCPNRKARWRFVGFFLFLSFYLGLGFKHQKEKEKWVHVNLREGFLF